jgi:four helix bundle suffix protein
MKKLRPSGGYRSTASFQTATLIYDATVWFCEKFVDARSRTVDQMVQAARSGRQTSPKAAAPPQCDPSDQPDLSDSERYALYARWLDHADAAVWANALICLIHQANYLLDRQIAALEAAFIADGGYSEQLAAERLRQRKKDQSDQPEPTAPQRPADRQIRQNPREPVLGLHELPRVQRHSAHLVLSCVN